jgi:hypothetical protein
MARTPFCRLLTVIILEWRAYHGKLTPRFSNQAKMQYSTCYPQAYGDCHQRHDERGGLGSVER